MDFIQGGKPMTPGHIAAWKRLQRVSLYHAAQLYSESRHSRNPRHVSVTEVIQENVGILGKGTEEDVKYRLMWYVQFFPSVFSAS
jgi:hypothetical protein